jgi:hypothetical protein
VSEVVESLSVAVSLVVVVAVSELEVVVSPDEVEVVEVVEVVVSSDEVDELDEVVDEPEDDVVVGVVAEPVSVPPVAASSPEQAAQARARSAAEDVSVRDTSRIRLSLRGCRGVSRRTSGRLRPCASARPPRATAEAVAAPSDCAKFLQSQSRRALRLTRSREQPSQ